jgi:hypothetical protein
MLELAFCSEKHEPVVPVSSETKKLLVLITQTPICDWPFDRATSLACVYGREGQLLAGLDGLDCICG